MAKYKVKLYARAYRDLMDIYSYISEMLVEPGVAEKMVNLLEDAIYSLEDLPERGAVRRVGNFANRNYRQLFIKKYIIIYRVLQNEVHIVTICYAPSDF